MVHGDDFVSVGSARAATEFRSQLEGRFEIKTQVLGPPGVSDRDTEMLTKGLKEGVMQEGRVLNIIIRWTEDGWEIEPDQRHVDIIVRDLNLAEAKPVSTPGEPEQKWEEEDNAVALSDVEASRYRALSARVNYLAADRTDIMYAVKEICRSMANPTVGSWKKLKRLGRYLKGNARVVTKYEWQGDEQEVTGYSDSDWANSTNDRRSTTGFYYSLNPEGPAISWKSRKQGTVALSSCEAEYMALAATVQEASFLHMLIKDLVTLPDSPINVYGDNQGAIALVKNPIIHNRSKHIDVRFHFIRDRYISKFVDIIYVPTNQNVADVMTKPTTKNKLLQFRKMLFGF